MQGPRKNFFGLEGFVWYVGVVEDRNDPEKMGRVRVRCFGWHTEDKELIPTNMLPWAHPMLPVNSPATYTPKEGDMVFGFFLDSDNAQNPVIVGVFSGKPKAKPDYSKGFSDPRTNFKNTPSASAYPIRLNEPTTSRLARGRVDGTVIELIKRSLRKNIKTAGGKKWSQPSPSYDAKYPYNYAHETESGHAFELDDTKGSERVHLAHKLGTYVEFDAAGNRVDKIVKDKYTVIVGNDYVSIDGDCSVTVAGNCNLKVGSKLKIEADEIEMSAANSIKVQGKEIFAEADSGDVNIKASNDMNITGGATASLSGSTTATVQAAVVDLAGQVVNLQSGSATEASEAGLSTSILDKVKKSEPIQKAIKKGIKVAKEVAGKRFTLRDTYGDALGLMDGAKFDLVNELSNETLVSKMNVFEDEINGMTGDILNLGDLQISEIRSEAFTVKQLGFTRDLDININELLLPKAEEQLKTALAKKLYPRTETVIVNPNIDDIVG